MIEQRLTFETDVIRQAQNGNQEAFRTLYDRYTDAIYRYIYKRVGESREAEDLTQTVFVKAWQALRDYQISGAPFQAWLYRIAHNAVIDHYRTRRDPVLWDDLAGLADPHSALETGVIQAEQQAVVQRALAELRPAYRDVLTRRFLHNLDYAETASELGQQVNNIRVLQHRALEALRRVLTSNSALRLSAVAVVCCLLLSGPLVVAAQQALPGDRLYSVRTTVEDARLWLGDDQADLRLHSEFAAERTAALITLVAAHRTVDVAALVTDLTEHLRAATTTFRALSQAGSAQPALTTEFTQAVQQQATTLRTLVTTAPADVQTTLQPALTAVAAAQAVLPTEQPTPSPTTPVGPTAPAPVMQSQEEQPTATATPAPPLTPTPSPAPPTQAAPTAPPPPVAERNPPSQPAAQENLSGRRRFSAPSDTVPSGPQAASTADEPERAPVDAAREPNAPRAERRGGDPALAPPTGDAPVERTAAKPVPGHAPATDPDQVARATGADPMQPPSPPGDDSQNDADKPPPAAPAGQPRPDDPEPPRRAPDSSAEQPAPLIETASHPEPVQSAEQPQPSPPTAAENPHRGAASETAQPPDRPADRPEPDDTAAADQADRTPRQRP